MADILILDDDRQTLVILASLLKTEGFAVNTCNDRKECVSQLGNDEYKLLLINLKTDFEDASDFAGGIRETYPEMPIVLGTARELCGEKQSDPRGITYVPKPFKIDQLLVTVQDVFEAAESSPEEQQQVMNQLISFYQQADLVALSEPMKKVAQIVERIAATEIPVFLYGEPGTDKELTARAIHQKSRHSEADFIVFNLKEAGADNMETALFGKEKAKGNESAVNRALRGTLMIDGIEHLTPSVQERFIKFLAQTRKEKEQGYPRLITTSEKSSAELATVLDPKLLAPLTAMSLSISPLRERREDIVPLAGLLLQRNANDGSAVDIQPEAARLMKQYEWPGNVNELAAVLSKAYQKARQNERNTITTEDILPLLHHS